MAAAQAQLHGMLSSQNDPSNVKWASTPLFGDVPTVDGMVRIERAKTWLYSISRGGSNLGANVERTDPGVGGAGNATVQAQFADRSQASREAVLSLVEATSALHFECSRAPFMDGADIWEYLPSKVYLRIQDDEAQDEIRRVQSWTVKDLPVDQQDETQVLRFKAKIQAYNPMRHPNMSITNQMKISIFCNGLHPDAKILALNMKNNLAQAQANNCCFPAVYPAGHPQAGAVHPQANQLSLDALAMYVHQQFSMKIRSGLVRLKGQPGVLLATSPNSEVDMSDVASELPVHKDAFLFASFADMETHGYGDLCEYSLYALSREPGQLRTCRNCGGVNHFSHKDNVLICPTAENSVPTSLLRNIRYPVGINPWRFGGRGKGKGKSFGKGKGSGKGGRGRGGYWTWQEDAPVPPEATPSEDIADNSSYYITDDFDGWNNGP